MDVTELIRKKRNGEELTEDEIRRFVSYTVDGTAQDCQVGAMLMAVYIRGLSDTETTNLTRAMVKSGESLIWDPSWDGILVDKHSTGGVGDKVSIALCPVLAACGLKVPMISGRGLEFTGGTLDKLESIPGFRVDLCKAEMQACLEGSGCFIASASHKLCPGDREFYKRRDVTATVDNTDLIVSSIISKKVVEGIKYLVVDVKVGQATFYKDIESARVVAKKLISTSLLLGIKTRVLLTRMESPIGNCIGNALEIAECVQCLRGKGPSDLNSLVTMFGGALLDMTGVTSSMTEGEEIIAEALKNGSGLQYFERMLIGQGVAKSTAHKLCYGDACGLLPAAKYITHFTVKQSGWIQEIDGLAVGLACWELGSGRKRADEVVDSSVGVKLVRVVSERVVEGEVWLELHHSNSQLQSWIITSLESAIVISNTPHSHTSRLIEVIQ